MIIKYFGHDEFLLENAAGVKILTDPYDPKMLNLKEKNIRADIVTVSHGHGDHSYIQKVEGYTHVVDREGVFEFENLRIRAIKSFHDEKHGALRGENLIFVYETEGLRLAHLGDLGHMPNEPQLESLKDLDVLFLPVGGKYTIDAKTAKQVAQTLKPKVIIPMHYKLKFGGLSDIESVDSFLAYMQPVKASYVNLLRITKEDILEQPKIAVIAADAEKI
jgi:L-ascorbate metabolism protein UlaG (beta-lactamase superfamily)